MEGRRPGCHALKPSTHPSGNPNRHAPNSTLIAAALLAALASSTAMAAGPSENAGHRARALVDAHPGWANRHVDDRFVVRNVVVDADGTEHVRMDRTYRGLPVFGGDIVVHSRNGQLKSVSKTLRSDLRPSQDARLTADDAIVEAGAVFGSGIDTVPSVRKVIYARDRAPRLAWEVGMRGMYADGTPLDMTFYVDAGNGNILSAHSNVHTGNPPLAAPPARPWQAGPPVSAAAAA